MNALYVKIKDAGWFQLNGDGLDGADDFLRRLKTKPDSEGHSVNEKLEWIYSIDGWWIPTRWTQDSNTNKKSQYIKASLIYLISKEKLKELKW